MSNSFLKGALSFRKMDELLVLLAVFFFIFGCVIIPEPPFPVELTAFSDLSTEKTLQFDSPGDTDIFQLNISRYTTVGNSSEPLQDNPGVVQNFSMRICPTEHMGSNASNLTLHWPTGGSVLFYPGILDSCQYVSINASEFNSYLAVHQAPSIASFISDAINGLDPDSLAIEWGISQENPKMHDIDDPITYQLMIVEPELPDSILSLLLQTIPPEDFPPNLKLLLNSRLTGLSYTCYDWDEVRETTSPSAIYPIRIPLPDMNITDPVELNLSGEIIMNATVFDLDCPAYETPGKYRAEVRKIRLDLKNYTGPIPSDYFYDEFDSPGLSERWIIRKTELSSYIYNPSMSRIELYSDVDQSPTTGIMMYYYDPFEAPTSNESGYYFTAKMYVDPDAENAVTGILFTNDTLDPAPMAEFGGSLRGGLILIGPNLTALCPDMTPAFEEDISAFITPGYYDFGYMTNNETAGFFFGSYPIAECPPQTEDIYISMTPDPLTDAFYGNTSVSLAELFEVHYVEEYYGEKWFDLGFLVYLEYINDPIYSDVLIFDADTEGDYYGRRFDFEVSSDTPGIVEVSSLNISYGSLISYGPAGSAPTTRLDPNNDFSWFAINSDIYNSDMRLNSFAYNSTLTNSEMVLSRIDCVNLVNSRMVFSGAIYNTEEQYIGNLPLPDFSLEDLETNCSGVVENSYMEFVFLIGGNVRNSDVRTLPLMVATDFDNAVFGNYTLHEGKMTINGTRIPPMFENELDLEELVPIPIPIEEIAEGGVLPLGCSEKSVFAMDSVKLRIVDVPAASLNCRFELHNSNLTLENLTFNNEFGGIRVSLDNSSTRIANMPELVNVTTYGQLTDVVIWNVNTSLLSGPLVMSSEGIYVETGMASANDSYPETNLTEITSLFQVSLIFNNVAEWDGSITYYDEFTTNKTEAMEEGVECPLDRCYYSEFDPATHVLRVDVSNFSTYVVNYTIWNDTNDTPIQHDRDRDIEYDLQIDGECAGEPVTFTAIHSGQGVEGLDIDVFGPSTTIVLYDSLETDEEGIASFLPETAAGYHYRADTDGYEYKAGTIYVRDCALEQEEEPIGTGEEPSQPEPTGPVVGCTGDSDCAPGHWCIDNECVPMPPEEPETEIPPFPKPPVEIPPIAQDVPPLPPLAEERAPVCCLAGICMEFLGLCWYYWMLAVLLILLIAAGIYYFTNKKK